VIEVDFTKSLAEITKSLAEIIQIEEPTQAAYHAQNMENKLEKTIKEADVKCKTKKKQQALTSLLLTSNQKWQPPSRHQIDAVLA